LVEQWLPEYEMNVRPPCTKPTGPSFTFPPELSQGRSGLEISTRAPLMCSGSRIGAMYIRDGPPALVAQPDQVAYSFPSAPVNTSGSIARRSLDSHNWP
jgi:hypothetical protein